MSSEDSPRQSVDSIYSTPSPPHSPMVITTRNIPRKPVGYIPADAVGKTNPKSNVEFFLDDSSSSPGSSVPGSAASLGDVDRNDGAGSTAQLLIKKSSNSILRGEACESPPPRPPRRVPSNVRFTADTAALSPSTKSTALSHSRGHVISDSSAESSSSKVQAKSSSSSPASSEAKNAPINSNSSSPSNSTQNVRAHFLSSRQISPSASPAPYPMHSNPFLRASSKFKSPRVGNRKPVPKVSVGDLDIAKADLELDFDNVSGQSLNSIPRKNLSDEKKSDRVAGFVSGNLAASISKGRRGFDGDPSHQIMKSTLLDPDSFIEKPWLVEEKPSSFHIFPCLRSRSSSSSSKRKFRFKKDKYTRLSYLSTIFGIAVGAISAAVFVFFSIRNVPILSDKNLCLGWEEDWSSGGSDGLEGILGQGVWQREVAMGGFGNGEFEMTSTSSSNSFVKDNILYIVPTLTTSTLQISSQNIFDGYMYNLTGCTSTNSSQCGVVSNATTGTMIPPVMSARLNTKLGGGGKSWMKYGRLEVKAKLPKGDWIWPAIWMLPVNDTYGGWPMSGEIDLMESRGNDITYPYQGRNYVRSTLNWGPNNLLNGFQNTFGWWKKPHGSYADDFHTYAMEWTEDFMRFYVDSRLTKMLQLKLNEPFFTRGQFPPSVFNVSDSQDVAVVNPWEGRGNSAPFDQPFYLILNVAVGGTNGWFPDRLGNKPWFDSSLDAMYNFAKAQDEWYSTWPEDPTERGMAVESIKMYSMC